MDEHSNDHRHGNKRKPVVHKSSKSGAHTQSSGVHGYISRRSSEPQLATRGIDMPREGKDKVKPSNDRLQNSQNHAAGERGDKVRKKLDSHEGSDDSSRSSRADRSKKYATWDKNMQKRRAKLQQLQQEGQTTADDSFVNRKGRELPESYYKLSRSISTDLATLRNKTQMLQSASEYNTSAHMPSAPYNQITSSQSQKTSDNNHWQASKNSNSYNSAGTQNTFKGNIPKQRTMSLGDVRRSAFYRINSNSPSIPSSPSEQKDTYIDIDSLIANDIHARQAEEDDLSFPTLDGYGRHGLTHSFPSAPFTTLKHLSEKSICSSLLGLILFLIAGFVLFLPLAAIFVVICPLCFLLKKLFSCCCCYGNKCQCGTLLSRKERAWAENIETSNVVYQCLVIVEYGLTTYKIRELVRSRLIKATDQSGNRLYPKFTRKIVQTFSGPTWIQDESFLINNHVFNMPSSIENMEDLQEYVSESSSKPLSMHHPLWEIQVLTDFSDQRDTIVLLRIHPCIADGISLVQLLYKAIVDMESITIAMPKFSSRRRFCNAVQAFFSGPLVFFKQYVFKQQDFNMLHGQHIHTTGKQVVAWSEPYSLEQATRISQVTRSTLNDIFLSVTAGCLRNYLQTNGIPNPYDMKALVPVHYHSGPSPLHLHNNDCLFIPVPIPSNTEGAIPRLWRVKHIMDKIGSLAFFSVTQGALLLSSTILPQRWLYSLWRSLYSKCTCIISDLPGPETTLKVASKQIKSVICWMPPIHQVAVAVSFFTYGDQVRMSVMADRSVLPNPEMLTKDFISIMNDLSSLLANRRIPGEQLSKKMEVHQLDCEIHAEPTVEQIQIRMTIIQQEIQELKVQLDLDGRYSSSETKLRRKIENLKEQFRELLVEMRQRKAAEEENAMILTDEDPEIEDDEDNDLRRPFRRRTLSISSRMSRMSTVSTSSTARPLASPSVVVDMYNDSDTWSQSSRMDGISIGMTGGRQTLPRRPHHRNEEFEILEYAHSPSMERRIRTA
ncbi:LOW QUALITY PROTEIN: uncharacterized protein LOC117327001 [Pecten maximus]|uniref:LOW QUALITY PROTEIN: uncharacterized protein LOC117327001 n=1 Tax=Pecten maximus TaxID=6579 RepID=UPI001458C504|nr:LOW QUALITY PROTEIN: uncharacterized protein LOC117327001 [Pecten maximus]